MFDDDDGDFNLLD